MNALFILHVLLMGVWVAANPLQSAEAEGTRITKRSLRTDFGTPLTGMEKISKRSVDDEEAGEETLLRERRQLFLPSFALHKLRRTRDVEEQFDDNDDYEVIRTKRNVFLPAFGRRRLKRSANLQNMDVLDSDDVFKMREERSVFLPSFGLKRQRRSLSPDDEINLQIEERQKRNVFLPAFARKRSRRSVPDDDDMEAAETSVFLPNFARREFRRQ